MSEAEYNLRLQIYKIGLKLRDFEIDPEDVYKIGVELITISKVCDDCKGDGIDGEPHDAIGEGGWIGQCKRCDSGLI